MKIAAHSPVAPDELHPARRKSRIAFWLKRIALWLMIGIITLAAVGAVYQTIATAMDRRALPAPGQRIDVGGYSLHLYCTGQNMGGRPTVILETGLGATSSSWGWIQPEIAKTTRVCAYDRAGMGWSDPSPAPRDAQNIATDLHTLLQNAQIPGPYVLAGWSYGGMYIRQYAAQYPDEVVGMVLLDSSSPEQCISTPDTQAQCDTMAITFTLAPILTRFGVLRLMGLSMPASGLPSPQNEELLASFSATKDWVTQSAEFFASPSTRGQGLNSESRGDIPLFVLSATGHDFEELWQGWQAGFTSLSTNSVQQVLPDATHGSILYDATHAKVSVESILKVVEAARTGTALK
ncbi:MAG TPA: alpha/beta hydrolase [Anaerolineales bacterium]|nr:alpha/beta hydrolase [Anaerolineales bacterium]